MLSAHVLLPPISVEDKTSIPLCLAPEETRWTIVTVSRPPFEMPDALGSFSDRTRVLPGDTRWRLLDVSCVLSTSPSHRHPLVLVLSFLRHWPDFPYIRPT